MFYVRGHANMTWIFSALFPPPVPYSHQVLSTRSVQNGLLQGFFNTFILWNNETVATTCSLRGHETTHSPRTGLVSNLTHRI
jgi:hypothetical protein